MIFFSSLENSPVLTKQRILLLWEKIYMKTVVFSPLVGRVAGLGSLWKPHKSKEDNFLHRIYIEKKNLSSEKKNWHREKFWEKKLEFSKMLKKSIFFMKFSYEIFDFFDIFENFNFFFDFFFRCRFFFSELRFFFSIDSMQKIVLFRFMGFSERSETGNPANEPLFDFALLFPPNLQKNPSKSCWLSIILPFCVYCS